MFGEVYDANPAFMSHVHHDRQAAGHARLRLPGAAQSASRRASRRPTLRDLYAGDDYYTDTDSNAYELPTFLGNHDMGRIGMFLKDGGATGQDLLQRDELANSLMFLTRGQPVVYYGDEQGFIGDGGDKDARQDMFASQGRRSYNDDADLIGGRDGAASDRYDTERRCTSRSRSCRSCASSNPALADGAQIHRYAVDERRASSPFSRIDAAATGRVPRRREQRDDAARRPPSTRTARTMASTPVYGAGHALSTSGRGRPGRRSPCRRCRSRCGRPNAADRRSARRPGGLLHARRQPGGVVGGRAEIGAAVPANGFAQVTFA